MANLRHSAWSFSSNEVVLHRLSEIYAPFDATRGRPYEDASRDRPYDDGATGRHYDATGSRHYDDAATDRQYDDATESRHYDDAADSRRYEDASRGRPYDHTRVRPAEPSLSVHPEESPEYGPDLDTIPIAPPPVPDKDIPVYSTSETYPAMPAIGAMGDRELWPLPEEPRLDPRFKPLPRTALSSRLSTMTVHDTMSRYHEVFFVGTICMAQFCTRKNPHPAVCDDPEADIMFLQRPGWARRSPSST